MVWILKQLQATNSTPKLQWCTAISSSQTTRKFQVSIWKCILTILACIDQGGAISNEKINKNLYNLRLEILQCEIKWISIIHIPCSPLKIFEKVKYHNVQLIKKLWKLNAMDVWNFICSNVPLTFTCRLEDFIILLLYNFLNQCVLYVLFMIIT